MTKARGPIQLIFVTCTAAIAMNTAMLVTRAGETAAPVILMTSVMWWAVILWVAMYDRRLDLCWRCDTRVATTDLGLCEPCREVMSDGETSR